MNYSTSKPSTLLSPYVKQYWTLEDCIPFGKEHIQRIIPNGLPEIMFYFGDRPVSNGNGSSFCDNSLVSGQSNRYLDLKISGKVSLFSILLKPHGLNMFFDIPQNELLNQSIPLKFLNKKFTSELETKLNEAVSFRERIQIAEDYLLKLLQQNKYKQYFDRMEQCIDVISRSRGRVSIDNLASESCLSRKQFERIFACTIGSTPKQFLKTIRFQHAIDIKSK